MFIKFLLLLFFIINLKLPIVSLTNLFFVFLFIILLVSSKKNITIKKIIGKYKIIIFIFLLSIINLGIGKLKIEEAHSTFINENDIKVVGSFIPKNVLVEIEKKFNKNFDVNRFIDSHSIWTNIDQYKNLNLINSPYAFSADSIFQNQYYTRQIENIDFSSREELRMGHVNTLKYNLIYDKHLRRILPYYVLFEFSKESKDSQICVNGNSYYYFLDESEKGKKINNLEFIKNKSNDCINLDKDFEKFYLIGFSINDSDNLEIIFKKSVYLKFYQVINFIIILLILVCSYNLLSIKISTNTIIYLVSIISTFLIALVKYSNQIFGFRYYRGGADGILHNSFGQDIIINILNHNFLEAIRGNESVFYNMPGHRYFNAFSKIFFGDTNYGYMVLVSLLPLLIYIFFKKYLSKKYAIYLFTSFIFLPIFENMGFGYFNYIWQMIRNHAESFSIVLIISCLIGIHNIDNKKLVPFESFKVFFIGLLLAFASISRPNFFPTCLILSLYIFLNYFFFQKKYLQSYSILIGFSAVLFCFLHNIYFANFFNFFVHQDNAATGNFQLMNLNTIS